MKHLYYLSAASFTQVDLGILPQLARTYQITYALIMPAGNSHVEQNDIREYCSTNNIDFKAFTFKRRQRDIRLGFEFLTILRDIRSTQPDIIYTISFDIPVLSLLCTTLSKKKTIIAIHDAEFHSGSKFALFMKFARKITISHFDSFQVFSKNQEKVFRRKYPKKKLYTIPLSLGYYGSHKSYSATRNLDHHNEIRFLFFGNILPYKGLKHLLTAVNNLSVTYSNFKLVIAGQCNNWDNEYEPLIANNKVITKMIHFIDSNAVPDLFLNAHYLVLPYSDATQSGPLMMAFNFNLPVITSDIKAFREVMVENTTGYLYEKADPRGLENVLEAALLREKDEYLKLLARLKEHVSLNYSSQAISKMYQIMFADVQP
jgi:glycosyltransferase involved in cell wall biosynthesis